MGMTTNQTKQLTESRTVRFRKESFEILYHYFKDSETGETLENDDLYELNQRQVYNQYREKYNLPFPHEIKDIREQYGVSAAKMSEILGFGINQYRNYEKGEIPSISNGRLIQMMRNPKEFKRMIELSETLSWKDVEKLREKISELIRIQKENSWNNLRVPNYLLEGDRPSKHTGFVKPNLNKLCNMLLYFAETISPHKTKMNKLLFYADFLHFKRTCYSISGSKYRAIQFGPVPQNFGSIYEFAHREGFIHIEYKECNDGVIQEKHLPSREKIFQESLFDDEELKTIELIENTFKTMKTKDIVNKSHEEDAWKDYVGERGIISYQKAFTLKSL